MKIKSNVGHNVSYHKVASCTLAGAPDYLTIPAGATLELDDKLWLAAYSDCQGLVGSLATGAVEIVVHAATSLTSDQICEVTFNQLGIQLATSKPVFELQTQALKLGVDLTVAPVAPVVTKKKTFKKGE